MKVTLIDYTKHAEDILPFTKATRLNLSPDLMEKLALRSQEEKLVDLEYMADTIPSSWEFASYTFLIEGVSRAFTHQFVRNRTGSYAQQSMRVTNMGEFEYVYPEFYDENPMARHRVQATLDQIKRCYQDLLDMGVPVEDARGILPTNIATNLVAKFNLRSLVDMVKSRSGGRTQGEYQKIINAMADAVLEVQPWAEVFFYKHGRDYFKDIEEFAKKEWPDDLIKKGELLKIVDKMRKG